MSIKIAHKLFFSGSAVSNQRMSVYCKKKNRWRLERRAVKA